MDEEKFLKMTNEDFFKYCDEQPESIGQRIGTDIYKEVGDYLLTFEKESGNIKAQLDELVLEEDRKYNPEKALPLLHLHLVNRLVWDISKIIISNNRKIQEQLIFLGFDLTRLPRLDEDCHHLLAAQEKLRELMRKY